jgi:tetratricopeptide (TPR) repeat protein
MKPKHVKQSRRPPDQPTAASELLRRRVWMTAILAVLCSLATAYVWADWYYGVPDDAQAAYVGRQSCLQCHQQEHEAWTGSHHDLAMDLATEGTVLGDFSDAQLEHHGVTSRMFKRDGKFFINTEGPDGKLADFQIKYVFGVDPLQQYMVEFDRPADMPAGEIARVQVLRVSWDVKGKRWFHLDPPDVAEKLDPTDDLHWTGIAQRWNNMCADCHSTNLRKNFDVESLTYHTTFSEIDVSCEACHGPGSLHVELAGTLSPFWDRKRGYALAELKVGGTGLAASTNQIQACAPCHSRRRVIHGDYTAGCNYDDYFSNELLSSTSYHADGQILDEVYEYGSFIQSKMYHKGIKCTDCHDPHTARLKHQGNQVCTSCHQHPAGKYDGANHHRHAEGQAGSLCVNCHMPETTYMAVDPRRDHSFRVPRPDLSVNLGTPNACTRCHLRDERLPGKEMGDRGLGTADGGNVLKREDLKGKEYADWLRVARDDEEVKARLSRVDRWADAQLDAWYGKQRKREAHFAEALHAARQEAPDASQLLIALTKDRDQPGIARATAASELGGYVRDNAAVTSALTQALADRDPQVRAAVVTSLEPAGQRTLLSTIAKTLDDPSRLVRSEAARVLAGVDSSGFRGEERLALRKAIVEAFAATEIDNDREGGHRMQGVLQELLGEFDEAEAAYRTALRVEPDSIGPRTNLAALLDRRREAMLSQAQQLVQSRQVDAAQELLAAAGPLDDEARRLRDGALGLLERDALLIPDEPGLLTRLGFTRHLQGWPKEAEHAFWAAHRVAPDSLVAMESLAVYWMDTGRPREALPLAKRLRELRPDDERFVNLEREVRQRLRAGPEPQTAR